MVGLAGTSNGDLLDRLEGDHGVFVTADKNLRYRQNLAGRRLAIVELPTDRLPAPKTRSAEIVAAVTSATPGSDVRVPFPEDQSGSDGPAA